MINKFKLKNVNTDTMLVCIEPVSTLFELKFNEELHVIVENISMPIEIKFSEYDNKQLISVWPNKGTLKVQFNNEIIEV